MGAYLGRENAAATSKDHSLSQKVIPALPKNRHEAIEFMFR